MERRVTLQITGLASALSIMLGGGAGTILASSQLEDELKSHEARINTMEQNQRVILNEIKHLTADMTSNDADRRKDLERIEEKLDRLLTQDLRPPG